MKLLTVPEVAERLRKADRFVLDELRRKKLPGSKYGGAWHVEESDLTTYIEAHRNVSRVKGKAS